jgi:D-alanyl-lipoteichoic acid acyltransferase DltB (MBOAT superfamily)
MLFNSLHFLFFLPVVIFLYYLLPHRFRWILIFAASCYFYMALVPAYIFILFFIILLDYFSALMIEKQTGRSRKIILAISICANIGLLAFFKYFNFANENLTWMLGVLGRINPVGNLDIILPIGLSFHTFQSMAYTIDVYRGRHPAEKHPGYFANYVLFFPQMVAGPIERYDRLGSQLKKEQPFLYENFAAGFRLMLFGFFAKMAIADNLAVVVNQVYADPAQHSSASLATAILFFSFQIYADFYGYSLIAMGAAKLMGIDLMENFKTPYLSKSISEFWQRWHISLSTWFRDYLYIPLGGNRVRTIRWIINILVVFLLSGLWHGARWTFVIWGLLHGVIYLLEYAANKLFNIQAGLATAFFNVLRIIKTFVIVSIVWIFFRAGTLDKANAIISSLFENGSIADKLAIGYHVWCLLLIFIVSDLFLFNRRIDSWLGARPAVLRWSIYAMLLFAVLAMGGSENLPFIYFQF